MFNRPRDWRVLTPLLIPAFFALLMVRVAAREASRASLREALIALAAESVLVYVVLRPWSYERRSMRSIVAVTFALPWTIVQARSIGDAGGIVQLHVLWLVMLDALLLLLVLLRYARRSDEE